MLFGGGDVPVARVRQASLLPHGGLNLYSRGWQIGHAHGLHRTRRSVELSGELQLASVLRIAQFCGSQDNFADRGFVRFASCRIRSASTDSSIEMIRVDGQRAKPCVSSA
eukprot:2438701-Prymnesium_polylepis.2